MAKEMNSEELNRMISTITSKKEELKEYEGFKILSDNIDNKLTKKQLVDALTIMWEILMSADKQTRDEKYLFGKGLLQFNEVFQKEKGRSSFSMSEEQRKKIQKKMINVQPLAEFLFKMKDIIK